jgi:hypothetical protein
LMGIGQSGTTRILRLAVVAGHQGLRQPFVGPDRLFD